VMDMENYYREGYLEAVMFLFVKNNNFLIEIRPKGNSEETFIPNGTIDKCDLDKGGDYRINAIKREIDEEYRNSIKVENFEFLGEYTVEKLKIRFYGYLITDWVGDIPKYSIENGKLFAKLKWIPLVKYKKYLSYESSLHFVNRAIERINI
jgi:hypothetical protein